MIYMLWKSILLGRRAFSQPEGLFEWDIDAFIIQCQPMNYHLELKKYVLGQRKLSMSLTKSAVLYYGNTKTHI